MSEVDHERATWHAAAARPATLRIVALGGISEVGRNMTMFETVAAPGAPGRLLVVDCGMLLGKTNAPGVDLACPTGRPTPTGSTTSTRSC